MDYFSDSRDFKQINDSSISIEEEDFSKEITSNNQTFKQSFDGFNKIIAMSQMMEHSSLCVDMSDEFDRLMAPESIIDCVMMPVDENDKFTDLMV